MYTPKNGESNTQENLKIKWKLGLYRDYIGILLIQEILHACRF